MIPPGYFRFKKKMSDVRENNKFSELDKLNTNAD